MKHAEHPCDLQLILSRSWSHTGAPEASGKCFMGICARPQTWKGAGKGAAEVPGAPGNQGMGEEKGSL